MKSTYSFYYMLLIVVVLNFLMYCEGKNSNSNKTESADSTDLSHEDTMSANLRDPVSAFPLPPVTGTQTDSSVIKDSLKDTSHRN